MRQEGTSTCEGRSGILGVADIGRQALNRTRQWVIIAVLTVVILGALVWLLSRQEATTPYAVQPQREGAVGGPAPMPARPPVEAAPKKTLQQPKRPKTAEESLPVLVPGNPLTDPKFTDMSAQIVIAALGLKQDADYEANLVAYMEKVLTEANISEEQYTEYAQALHNVPDRGRAVAEGIIMKVERKVGYQISVEKLPMFKMDPEQVKKLEGSLKRKGKK